MQKEETKQICLFWFYNRAQKYNIHLGIQEIFCEDMKWM